MNDAWPPAGVQASGGAKTTARLTKMGAFATIDLQFIES
jgi:hypothetical protein